MRAQEESLAALKRLIIERTEGNPFFMEEIVQALFEQGALIRNGAVRLTAPLSQLRIPPTVQAILAARIDRLPVAHKQLLQTLAVVGREFPLPLIRQVTQLADDELEPMLAGLQTGEFIYEQPATPDVEYSFKHALTQEVAYGSILTERRRIIHGQTAAAIEALHSSHLEDHLGELAHHYSRSGNAAKAVEYLRLAAEQATARSAFEEAASHLNAALVLLDNLAAGPARDSQELALRMGLMVPNVAIRGFGAEETRSNAERARALCTGLGDTMTEVRVLTNLQAYYLVKGQLRVGHEIAQQIVAIAQRKPNEITTYFARFSSFSSVLWLGDLQSAREHLEQLVATDENTINAINAIGAPPISGAIAFLSLVLWMLGYPDRALRLEARLRGMLARPLSLFDRVGTIWQILWLRCPFLRDYREARQQAEELLALSRENGFSFFVGDGLVRLGRAMVEQGNFTEGIENHP